MKGPKDKAIKGGSDQPADKARQRLQQFSLERGIEDAPVSPPPAAKRKKKSPPKRK